MKKKQILVLGLGRFGRSLALTSQSLGLEVFGLDKLDERVADVAEKLTHSAVGDCTDARTLKELQIDQFDVVVCAIGGHLESSLMTALLAKENGAKRLVCKAVSHLHQRILQKIGADQVIFPEEEVASRLARDFIAPEQFVEVVPLTVQHSMFELKAPASYSGYTIGQLELRRHFGINVIAIRRGEETVISPGPDEVIRREDLLVAIGDRARAKDAIEFDPADDSEN